MKWEQYLEHKDIVLQPWMHKIPSHWHWQRLKWSLSDIESGKRTMDEGVDLDSHAFSVGGEHISWEGDFILDNPRFISYSAFLSMKKGHIREKDVLMVKDGATIGKTAFVRELPYEHMAVNEHVFILRPKPSMVEEFLSFLLRSQVSQYQLSILTTGAAQPGLSSDFAMNLWAAIPTYSEQCAIVTFLKQETERIDNLIRKKEKQIEILHEKRSAIINQFVTKGAEPNFEEEDSCVEWLGQIPAHWEIVRAKVLFHEVKERSTTGTEELLTVSHITGVTRRADKNVSMFMAESLEGYKKCQPNELIINTMWAWMGAMGITSEFGIVSPSYNVYRFRSNYDVPSYYDYLFQTSRFKTEVTCLSKGVWSSRLRLYPEAFFEIRLPRPPREEQLKVVMAIQDKVGDYDILENRIKKSIAYLQEYRTALITAVVTGKIDDGEHML